MIPGWKFSNIGIIASFLIIVFIALQERRHNQLCQDDQNPTADKGKGNHAARLLQEMLSLAVCTQRKRYRENR